MNFSSNKFFSWSRWSIYKNSTFSLWNFFYLINNIFFNCAPVGSKYPLRNFTTAVIKKFIHQSAQDWYNKYKDTVIGHETLIQPPRTGELYRRAGFCKVGVTKGYTCKRVAGTGTDDWSGKRVWDTKNLVPKIVMCRKYDEWQYEQPPSRSVHAPWFLGE